VRVTLSVFCCCPVLATGIDLAAPMTWAIIIGWIMTVVLHEFSHGLVAHLGVDYTIRERGGLTLNPLHYVDPVFSIVLPVLFVIMGGIPLPGGATFIRRDLLRNRWWEAAVAAAGPLSNFILFILCALPFHPALGWIRTDLPADQFLPWQIFLGAMAQLQMIAVLLNLVPVPPLDGFNIIGSFIPERTRLKLATPPVSSVAFLLFFLILWQSPVPMRLMYDATHWVQEMMHFDASSIDMMSQCFNIALFGRNY
jgi:Zn-dependent protease